MTLPEGELAPVLDTLIDTVGARTWRVIVESHENWEPASGRDGVNVINGAYYRRLYETPKFQSLWAILSYLQQRGQTQVMLNVMGAVPDALGRTMIRPDAEDRWVEMIASLVAYGRQVKDLPVTALSPMNEVDLGFPEGPRVDAAQYARLLGKLSTRLDDLSLGDVTLVAPDIASPNRAQDYFTPLLADRALMGKIAHFSVHDYGGNAGDADALITRSGYPDRNFWMTEYSASCGGCDRGAQAADQWDFAADTIDQLMAYLQQGAASALIYDGYDSFYEHHNSMGHWGLVAYNPARRTYTPRKRLYALAQAYRFAAPGMTRIGVTAAGGNVTAVAFTDRATGDVTIVGHNRQAQAVTMTGRLANLPAVGKLAFSQTTPTANMESAGDVALTNGMVTLTVAADSVFTLTNRSGPAAPPAAPTVEPTPRAGTRAPSATSSAGIAQVSPTRPTPMLTPTPPSTATRMPVPGLLVGNPTIEARSHPNAAGTAEAFSYTATASGTVGTLAVYLDPDSTARTIVVGLYADGGTDTPDSLLTQATIAAPVAGAWNVVVAPAAVVTMGTRYWIAVLAPVGAGTVQFRDLATGGGRNQTSARTTLTTLPGTWEPGASDTDALMSAYAAQDELASSASVDTPAGGTEPAQSARSRWKTLSWPVVLVGSAAGAAVLLTLALVARRARQRRQA